MNKELQKKYLELQIIDQQIKEFQRVIQNIETQILDIRNIQKSLDEFEKTNVNEKILVPLSNGIFAEATLKDNKKLKVNVGSDIVVEKSVQKTKELMDKQMDEILKYRDEVIFQFQGLIDTAQKIEKEIQGTE